MSLFKKDVTNRVIQNIIIERLKTDISINRNEIIDIIISKNSFLFKEIENVNGIEWVVGNMVDWFSASYTLKKLPADFLEDYEKVKMKSKGRYISCFQLKK
ncbi:hypothetical protein [Providencia stuartii]|uniref:hypothetical protein n=1 Tax=Providencia stuartii TaxID=588 RepID=UPI0027EF51E9|nr:hypothetical protein [Providencia stuartii]MDQ5991098.1 hypothetical protein [Providencia stuartii]